VKFLKISFYTLFFAAMLLLFLPKENLYYYAKERLVERYGLFLDEKQVDEKLYTLSLKQGRVSYEGIEIATYAEAKAALYLFTNTIRVEDIVLSSLVKNYLPLHIEYIVCSYTLLEPLHISLDAKGGFGSAKGSFSLEERKLSVEIEASKELIQKYKRVLRYLKKTGKGVYRYEKTL